MSTDAFEQLIDVPAPGGASYPVQRGHRRGVRSPHTFDAARWPPSSLTSPYAPQGSTTAVLGRVSHVPRRVDDVCRVRRRVHLDRLQPEVVEADEGRLAAAEHDRRVVEHDLVDHARLEALP